MRHRIKLFALIVLVIASMLIVAGCGADTSTFAGSTSTVSEDEDEQDQVSEAVSDSDENAADDRAITVILNANEDRKRIHMPGTSCADKIHEENYLEWTGTTDELKMFAEENGYVPCGTCHPETKLNIDLPKRK